MAAAQPGGNGVGGDEQQSAVGMTEVVLLCLLGMLAFAAVLPLLVVATPAWLVWRRATGWLPRWTPLAALALLAGGAWLAATLVAAPAGSVDGIGWLGQRGREFVDLQLATGKAVLDAAIDSQKQGIAFAPAGVPAGAFARDYTRQVWPFALAGGAALALAGDAWLRLVRARRRAGGLTPAVALARPIQSGENGAGQQAVS
jgi:hypothetical protein